MGGGGREKGKLPGPKGKRESSPGPPGPTKETPHDLACQKGKGKRPASTTFDPIPLGNQTARTHARTKRNDFPVEHPPTSDFIAPHAS